MQDYYEVLGVPRDADDGQIRRAYRRMIVEVHPDKPNGDAEKARLLDEARQVLLDPAARARHDANVWSPFDDDLRSLDDDLFDDDLDDPIDIVEAAVEHVSAAVRARGPAVLSLLRKRLASRFRAKRR